MSHSIRTIYTPYTLSLASSSSQPRLYTPPANKSILAPIGGNIHLGDNTTAVKGYPPGLGLEPIGHGRPMPRRTHSYHAPPPSPPTCYYSSSSASPEGSAHADPEQRSRAVPHLPHPSYAHNPTKHQQYRRAAPAPPVNYTFNVVDTPAPSQIPSPRDSFRARMRTNSSSPSFRVPVPRYTAPTEDHLIFETKRRSNDLASSVVTSSLEDDDPFADPRPLPHRQSRVRHQPPISITIPDAPLSTLLKTKSSSSFSGYTNVVSAPTTNVISFPTTTDDDDDEYKGKPRDPRPKSKLVASILLNRIHAVGRPMRHWPSSGTGRKYVPSCLGRAVSVEA